MVEEKDLGSFDKMDGLGSGTSNQGFAARVHPSSSSSSPNKYLALKRRHSFSEPHPKTLVKKSRSSRTSSSHNIDIINITGHENTIIFSRHFDSDILLDFAAQYLLYSVKNEISKFSTVPKRRRVALLVTGDDLSAHRHHVAMHSIAPNIPVDIYHAENGNVSIKPWTSFLLKDIVIITLEALLESLANGTLTMTQLHTLVFSNVLHHSGHLASPIREIMEKFFLTADRLLRPRIFGFASASPGCACLCDAASIESAMKSMVLRLSPSGSSGSLFLLARNEVVLFYDIANPAALSPLSSVLESLVPQSPYFLRIIRETRKVLEEVGTCASNIAWQRTWKQSLLLTGDEAASAHLDATLSAKIQECIKNWPFVMPKLDPTSQNFNVTHKFLMLVEALRASLVYGQEFRGVILVRHHVVALAVADLLKKLEDQLCSLRIAVLPGGHSLESSKFLHTCRLFIEGAYNLLILPVLDENLELPKLSTVICFDKFDEPTLKIIGIANTVHLIHLKNKTSEESPDLTACRTVQDPKSTPSSAPTKIDQPDEGVESDYIQDPTTSNRIYLWDAIDAVSRIGNFHLSESDQILFSFEEQQTNSRTFTCTVNIPGLIEIVGPPRSGKDDAKRAACFGICDRLYKSGFLDSRFFPPRKLYNTCSYHSKSSEDLHSAGARCYAIKEPTFWSNAKGAATATLYPIVISTPHKDGDAQVYSPMALLTRQPLPSIQDIKIFLAGIPTIIRIQRAAPFNIDEAQLHNLYLYTLRVCRIISNKPFECLLPNLVYFFAPLPPTWTMSGYHREKPLDLPSITHDISWGHVKVAAESYGIPLKMASSEEVEKDIHDAVVQDRAVEFTRRYFTVKLRPDLSPSSKPLDSPREAAYDSIFAFCKARRKDFKDLRDKSQPLIQVRTVSAVLNQLNPTSRQLPPLQSHAKYLIPELCTKCTIPASTLRTAQLLPSILRRIDELLLVKELNATLFDHGLSDTLLHTALCTPSCGVEHDYERLELLGDAFLKYIASLYVFVAHPTHSEGSLHVARQELISNKSLFSCARSAGVPAYIQSKLFSPKHWLPPEFTVKTHKKTETSDIPLAPSGTLRKAEAIGRAPVLAASHASMGPSRPSKSQKRNKKRRMRKRGEDEQWLGDKAIADVAEAMIGAGYITGGQEMGLKVVKALGLPILNINTWGDFGRQAIELPIEIPPSPPLTLLFPRVIATIIGYEITQPNILAQALSHPSVHGHDAQLCERLEFIGDAILDFMVIRHIYTREPQLTPGGLTLLKGAMVSNATLAAICACSGLHSHFVHKSQSLGKVIQTYTETVISNYSKECKNSTREGRSPGQFWLEISAPKVLSDIIESLMGAIYVTDQFSPVGVEMIFDKLFKPFYDKYITLKTLSLHPTKLLFELFQRQQCSQFKIINDKVPGTNANIAQVLVHDVILASAEDSDVTIAARRASFFALDALEGDPSFFPRTCDCRLGETLRQGKAFKESAQWES